MRICSTREFSKTAQRGAAGLGVCQVELSEGILCISPVRMCGTVTGVLHSEAHNSHNLAFLPFHLPFNTFCLGVCFLLE